MVAVLVYRGFTFWLPMIPGVVAYFQLRRTVDRWKAAAVGARRPERRYTIQTEVRNLRRADMADVEQIIIIGSGPAGYTAALYTARANLSPLVIEGFLWGGLLQQTTDVENYPGLPRRDHGPRAHADHARPGRAVRRALRHRQRHALRAGRVPRASRTPCGSATTCYQARAVVLAMGAEHKKLGVPGEEELGYGRGVSYCATCDAAFFKDRETIIVGGGDSAMEEAIFLAKFSSKVTVVHRRDEFRASQIMLERARETENIELLTPYVVEEFLPGEGGGCSARPGCATPRRARRATCRWRARSWRSATSRTSELVRGMVETDENGYVITEGRSTRTALPGVFAAGDLVDHTYRQAVTAAGSGCMAALDAEWYLRDNPHVPTPPALEGTGDLAEAQWAPTTSRA